MFKEELFIKLADVELQGRLTVPPRAEGIVIFSHGSGSSRLSARNILVADKLAEMGLATLLFDLLTVEEDTRYENRFNIDLLTVRLIGATQWLKKHNLTRQLTIGYFGASTGAASALRAAAYLGPGVAAVVSRGGRPDLAGEMLDQVMAPTLLIVGSLDKEVIELNQQAFNRLKGLKEMKIVKGASHLFEEKGKMEEVAELAASWYGRHMLNVSYEDVMKKS